MGLAFSFFFSQAEDGIRDHCVTGVQTCDLPIWPAEARDDHLRLDLLEAPAELVEDHAHRAVVHLAHVAGEDLVGYVRRDRDGAQLLLHETRSEERRGGKGWGREWVGGAGCGR